MYLKNFWKLKNLENENNKFGSKSVAEELFYLLREVILMEF